MGWEFKEGRDTNNEIREFDEFKERRDFLKGLFKEIQEDIEDIKKILSKERLLKVPGFEDEHRHEEELLDEITKRAELFEKEIEHETRQISAAEIELKRLIRLEVSEGGEGNEIWTTKAKALDLLAKLRIVIDRLHRMELHQLALLKKEIDSALSSLNSLLKTDPYAAHLIRLLKKFRYIITHIEALRR